MQTTLVVIGTRPELIKLAPVVRALKLRGMPAHTVFTGQHRELIAPSAEALDLTPDQIITHDAPAPSLSESLARQLRALELVIAEVQPATIIAQGDTSAAMAAAMAALYHRVRLGHVEAGLRADALWSPHPEEGHRRAIAALATWHFAPTARARAALLAEGVSPDAIHVTGNTAIDALRALLEAGEPAPPAWVDALDAAPILVTMHRRENMGAGLRGVIEAARTLAATRPVIWPLHPNPAIAQPTRDALQGVAGVHLCDALPYPALIGLLGRAALVITDSGGLQEEAPALGVPVLVARDKTERAEGIAAGLARLVGCDPATIVSAAHEALEAPRGRPAAGALLATPYGDGHAAARIVEVLARG